MQRTQKLENYPNSESYLAIARHIMAESELKKSFLNNDLSSGPAWNILLDLFAEQLSCRKVTVSSACIASGVPYTTALRCISRLEDTAYVWRTSDRKDKRLVYVQLTDAAFTLMNKYIEAVARNRQNGLNFSGQRLF